MKPSQVTVDGTTYEVAEGDGAFRVIYEPSVQRQGEIPGTSRPASNARPDELTWVRDNWSAGEGFKFFVDDGQDASKNGFYRSSTAVDTYVPGQISLGLDHTGTGGNLDRALAPTGPIYLTLSGGNIWAVYDSTTDYIDSTDVTWGAGWTNVTSGMNAQTIVGPITPHHSGIFIAGARSGADGGLRRVTTGGNTSWAAENASSPLAADNRVYYIQRGTTTTVVKRSGLDAAATGSTVYTINGVGSSFSGSAICMAAVGSRIYIVTSNDNESARLHVIENDVGREVAVLDGLRIPATETGPNTNVAFNRICVVNGIVFIAGCQDIGNGQTRPRVDYYDGQTWGTATLMDWREDQWGGSITASCLFPGRRDELFIGTGIGVFRYDLRTGGVTQYTKSTGVSISSGVYVNGRVVIAQGQSAAGSDIVSSFASGTGKFIDTVTVTEPIYDFGYPLTPKVLTEIEVHTETLADGTSIEVQVVLDDTTTVTTDYAGATMAHSSGTRTKFTVSDYATERVFRYMQPKVLLKTSNTANTPILYSVTYKCRAAEKVKFYEVKINGKQNKTPTQAVSGAKAMQTLRTLTENTSNRIVSFTPYMLGAPPPAPRGANGSSTAENVQIDAASFDLDRQGEGTATLRLRVL